MKEIKKVEPNRFGLFKKKVKKHDTTERRRDPDQVLIAA